MPLTEFDAATGERLQDDAAPVAAPARYEVLDIRLVVPSLTNPRKIFDPEKLAGLAASIRASGVHEPVIVRPLPPTRMSETFDGRKKSDPLPAYELVAGERRLRASLDAGVATIPAMIRSLSDEEALRLQIVENLQRDDLTELEEAEGYEQLLTRTGQAKETLGDEIGRSRSYVYARLKILDLCGKAREALRSRQIDFSKALLIARIPDEKLQLKALGEFTKPDWQGEPISQRSAQAWIRNNVMLKLADARFSVKDARLLEAAGACTTCEKRTGANPDLFADVDSPDICTDTKCFHTKEEAHIAKVTAKARESGMEVIEGKAAKEIMPSKWGSPRGYERVEETFEDAAGNEQPLRKLMTKEEREQIKLFVNPHTGEAEQVVTSALVEAISARLHPDAAARRKEEDREDEVKHRAFQLQDEYERSWRSDLVAHIRPHLGTTIDRFEPQMLRALINAIVSSEYADEDHVREALSLPEEVNFWEPDDIDAHVRTLPDVELGQRLCLLMLLKAAETRFSYHEGERRVEPAAPVLEELANACGADVKAAQAARKREMREAIGDEATAKAAPAKKAKGKKSKGSQLSAEEAQAGIADAMQQLDEGSPPEGDAEDPAANPHHFSNQVAWPFPQSSKP